MFRSAAVEEERLAKRIKRSRETTGAHEEAGAREWIAAREEQERRRYLVGEDAAPLTFAGAAALYQPTAATAGFLVPILEAIGTMARKDITPIFVRELAARLYPDACTDTWLRQVITPVRAVINNAHDRLGDACPPIRIRGFKEAERVAQDRRRGKPSNQPRQPGSWEWLLRFRQVAPPRLAALALFMFATGARIGQATRMHPRDHLDLQNGRACVPGAKGLPDRWISVPMELVVELANLQPRVPRGWPHTADNLRVFGYASRFGVMSPWRRTCTKAGIDYLPPHSAGRHGFGQEFNVRNPVDEKAAGAYGGWRNTGTMRKTYTHEEDADAKIIAQFRTGLVHAEQETGIKLLKTG